MSTMQTMAMKKLIQSLLAATLLCSPVSAWASTNETALVSEAASSESTLAYGEPPQWLQPVRHTLGAVYLKAQQYPDAERVYRED